MNKKGYSSILLVLLANNICIKCRKKTFNETPTLDNTKLFKCSECKTAFICEPEYYDKILEIRNKASEIKIGDTVVLKEPREWEKDIRFRVDGFSNNGMVFGNDIRNKNSFYMFKPESIIRASENEL